MDRILISVKKMLGIEPDYTHFDPDIILNINTVLMTLNQLGVGPETGFIITGDTETWVNFIGDRKDIEAVKTFIYLKVRLLFDPPSSSFVLAAMDKQISELEWRINAQCDKVMEGGTVIEQ